MKEAMDIVRDRQTRMETSYFNLIVAIGLTGEQDDDEDDRCKMNYDIKT